MTVATVSAHSPNGWAVWINQRPMAVFPHAANGGPDRAEAAAREYAEFKNRQAVQALAAETAAAHPMPTEEEA